MQLNLFQWDLIETGRGFESLAMLDFAEARRRFAKVLTALPEHREASRGLRDVEFWEDAVSEADRLELDQAIGFLWGSIRRFPFENYGGRNSLRLTLLGRLLVMMSHREALYIPPDLCRGFLHLQLGDYAAAASELQRLLERLPDNGRLRAYLADALWMQAKKEAAAETYAVALLASPHEVNASALRNRRLAELIREHGPDLAPMYGYMTGELPLVKPEAKAAGREARAYMCLVAAERARLGGDYPAMVSARRDFKELAPAVFRDYLNWVAAIETAGEDARG